MPSSSPHDTLQQIQEGLNRGLVPQLVIEELTPLTRAEAVTWIRRLPSWEEFGGQFPPQVVALARVISQRGMRAFGLKLSEDGRVVTRNREGPPWQTPKPSMTFRLTLGGEEVLVAYTPFYFPDGRTDYFYFISPLDPPRPHCLSETGYLSVLPSHDVVEACGGPKAYAALYAEARLRGEDQKFAAASEGEWPQTNHPRRQKVVAPASPPAGQQLPVLGEHTGQVVAKQQDKKADRRPSRERSLFDELP
jgi:hypothetical protein